MFFRQNFEYVVKWLKGLKIKAYWGILGILIIMLYGCSSIQEESEDELLFNGERGEGRPNTGAGFHLSPINNEGSMNKMERPVRI